jgi:predicted nucleic acid-binding protein
MMPLPDLIGLDTNNFIYYFEGDGPRTRFLVSEVMAPMKDGRMRVVTSAITLAEALVPGFRLGDELGTNEFRQALIDLPGLTIRDIDIELATLAAGVRARTGFKLLDAFQVAAAIEAGAGAFLTNDQRLIRDDAGIPMLLLDDLVSEWEHQ